MQGESVFLFVLGFFVVVVAVISPLPFLSLQYLRNTWKKFHYIWLKWMFEDQVITFNICQRQLNSDVVMFCKTTSLAIFQHHKDVKWVTTIFGAHLESELIVWIFCPVGLNVSVKLQCCRICHILLHHSHLKQCRPQRDRGRESEKQVAIKQRGK